MGSESFNNFLMAYDENIILFSLICSKKTDIQILINTLVFKTFIYYPVTFKISTGIVRRYFEQGFPQPESIEEISKSPVRRNFKLRLTL